LFRSTDGAAWTRVDVAVTDTDEDETGYWVNYSNLIRVDDGFAVLRTRTLIERPSTFQPRETVIERLVSPLGATWTIDEQFSPITQAEDFAFPVFHTVDTFAAAPDGSELPAPLGPLMEQVIADGTSFDPAEICFIEQVGTLQFRAFTCADGSIDREVGIAVTETDLADPEMFEEVLDCALLIQDANIGRGGSLIVQRRGEEPVEIDASFTFFHTPLSGGAIASFFDGDLILRFEPEVCDPFPGVLAEAVPPALEVLDPDNSVRHVPFPDELQDSTDITQWRHLSLLGTDTGLLAVLDRSVWQLNPTTDEWTKLVDVPESISGLFNFGLIDDERAFGIDTDLIAWVDLLSGEVIEVEQDLGDFAFVVYLDDQVAIVESQDGERSRPLTVIDLPQ